MTAAMPMQNISGKPDHEYILRRNFFGGSNSHRVVYNIFENAIRWKITMWPVFDSKTPRHMWVEFVVGSRRCALRGFFSGFPVFFSLYKNQHFQIPVRTGIRGPEAAVTCNPRKQTNKQSTEKCP